MPHNVVIYSPSTIELHVATQNSWLFCSVIMLCVACCVIIIKVSMYKIARYAESCVKCHYAECHLYTNSFMLNFILPNVILLNAIVLNVKEQQ